METAYRFSRFWPSSPPILTGFPRKLKFDLRLTIFALIRFPSTLLRRTLLDEKMSAKNLANNERDTMLGELAKKETEFIRFRRLRLTHNEFENIRLIGRGAFGEVRSWLTSLGQSPGLC